MRSRAYRGGPCAPRFCSLINRDDRLLRESLSYVFAQLHIPISQLFSPRIFPFEKPISKIHAGKLGFVKRYTINFANSRAFKLSYPATLLGHAQSMQPLLATWFFLGSRHVHWVTVRISLADHDYSSIYYYYIYIIIINEINI